ncbi:MAG: carotenoid 1,2-hydratase [Chloroflexi bacterium]|nr:carotenoid 1,2-hydratase [Chloroflexota bacterium]
MKIYQIAIAFVLLLTACGAPVAPALQTQLTVAESMNRADTSGFNKAIDPRVFSFPADHGPHDGYAVEWWYFTGNLTASDGRELGYQFTLFRSAIVPPTDETPAISAWRSEAAFMGHLAVTDVTGQRFFAYERFSREAVGLAGAQAAPFRVWLDDWQVQSDDPAVQTMRLVATEGEIGLDLTLDSSQPPLLQGDAGLSQKSAGVGNASYYYSMTRMPTTGQMTIAGETYTVTGNSWMDREWSTSALADDQEGWDWFALHFADGSDMMIYHLRRTDGTSDPYSAGIYRGADGQVVRLKSADIVFVPQGSWQSPHTGGVYPAAWQIQIQPLDLTMTVTPALADQELQVTVRYWEGAVRIQGEMAGAPIRGVGYLEMTGYADRR